MSTWSFRVAQVSEIWLTVAESTRTRTRTSSTVSQCQPSTVALNLCPSRCAPPTLQTLSPRVLQVRLRPLFVPIRDVQQLDAFLRYFGLDHCHVKQQLPLALLPRSTTAPNDTSHLLALFVMLFARVAFPGA